MTTRRDGMNRPIFGEALDNIPIGMNRIVACFAAAHKNRAHLASSERFILIYMYYSTIVYAYTQSSLSIKIPVLSSAKCAC